MTTTTPQLRIRHAKQERGQDKLPGVRLSIGGQWRDLDEQTALNLADKIVDILEQQRSTRC